jgi:adenylate kinase family enzyme
MKNLRLKYDGILIISPPFGGKNTQCALIQKYFKENSYPYFFIETGKEFHSLDPNNYTAKLIKDRMTNGSLLPDFLAESIVVSHLMTNSIENYFLIFNGYPRNKNQALKFIEIMEFYKKSPVVVFINTPNEEIIRRFHLGRGNNRLDDNEETLIRRLKIYKDEYRCLINKLRFSFDFEEIDGSLSKEEIYNNILNNCIWKKKI